MSAKRPKPPTAPTTRADNVAALEPQVQPPAPDSAVPRGAPPADLDAQAPLVDFDALVGDILENPEKVFASDLTPEQILEVQKRLNPYAGRAGPLPAADRKRVAAVSYTNLREDYLRRFTMTSLVGFVHQLLHEWEVPAEQRRWTPAARGRKGADAAATAAAAAPFEAGALAERLEATAAIARAAQAAAAELRAAQGALRERELLKGDGPRPAHESVEAAAAAGEADKARTAELEAKVAAGEARAAGLLYAASHAAHSIGLDASGRLRATADAALRFPAVKEVLASHPLPPPPSQIEMPAATAKAIVEGFVRHWLVFDPSVHVRSGHDAKAVEAALEKAVVAGREVVVDSKDPGHLPLEAVLAAAPEPAPEHADAYGVITASRESYNAVARLLRDDDLLGAALTAVDSAAAFRAYLLPVPAGSPARPAAENVPPQDTFHRWAYYTEVNYEELRTVTEALYPERPDLDWALALWEVFEGTPAEVDAAFDKHCQRYQDEVPSSIRSLEFGGWSLLADFKANREKIQFYNRNTEVLKRILDRHAEDKRIGADLMRNRVRQTKARNIAEDGPDALGLKEYRRNLAEKGLDLTARGVERVLGPEEMRRLEKARGSVKAAKELELLEQTEKRIAELTELEALRKAGGKDLAADEREELTRHQRELARVREMVAVPDDAVQVDVFTSNPATGGFAKTHFYTKAEAPEHLAHARAEAEAGRPTGSEHPAVLAALPPPDPAAQAAQSAQAQTAMAQTAMHAPHAPLAPLAPLAQGVPPFAPYAVEHILRADQRTPAAQHAEAVHDASSRR